VFDKMSIFRASFLLRVRPSTKDRTSESHFGGSLFNRHFEVLTRAHGDHKFFHLTLFLNLIRESLDALKAITIIKFSHGHEAAKFQSRALSFKIVEHLWDFFSWQAIFSSFVT
jgi:hypothetical protein